MPRTQKTTKKEKGRSKSRNFRADDSDDESVCESMSSLGLDELKDTTSDYESDKEFGVELNDFLNVVNEKSSSQDRVKAIKKMSAHFANNYTPGRLIENQSVIIESLKRILKRGGESEKMAAADLIPLMCLQLECEPELLLEFRWTLQRTYQDATERDDLRAKCCNSLAMLVFLSGNDIQDVVTLIEDISRQIAVCFSSSVSATVTKSTFYAAALHAQNLLLTLLEANNIVELFEKHNRVVPEIEKFRHILGQELVDLRLESGISLAIIYEIGRQSDSEFMQKSVDQLLPIIKDLATVSHKCRSKKEQKSQRTTFRSIKDFLESPTAEFNDQKMKFKDEVIELDSWCKLKQYEHVSGLLGSGLQLHIAKNQIVRNIFNLGVPLPTAKRAKFDASDEDRRGTRKSEKNFNNSKLRKIDRNKARNKRSVDFDDF